MKYALIKIERCNGNNHFQQGGDNVQIGETVFHIGPFTDINFAYKKLEDYCSKAFCGCRAEVREV